MSDETILIVERRNCAHGLWWCEACRWRRGLPAELSYASWPFVLLEEVLVKDDSPNAP